MVHGATADHTALSRVIPLLEPDYTVHAMDRRGRGLSGDTPPYDITLEYADVARLVDQVATEAGDAVSLYGHSYGAICALGAATLTRNVRRLFLYEPGYQGVVLTPDDRAGPARRAGGGRRVRRRPRARLPVRRRHVSGRGRGDASPAELAGAGSRRHRRSHASSGRPPTCRSTRRRSRTCKFPRSCCSATGARPDNRQWSRLCAALPSSDVVVLPDQAHAAQVTAPDLIADTLRGHRFVPRQADGTTNTTVIEKGPP